MDERKLRRIAELSALCAEDAEGFETEFCYITRAMEEIPMTDGDSCGDNINADDLRCDIASKYCGNGLFNNAPRKNGEFIITRKTVGV